MWPMLLNMNRDDCRRTLRRLELEAYSNMIDVFRAQGALEDSRKKILEELRAVLHISSDRHSAEARRVANDELLATIADQLSGPNTGIGWINEGRRRVPLMPRGIPQTAYTEAADKVAEAMAEENKELRMKLDAEALVAPKTNEEELPDAEGETAESALTSAENMEEMIYPPVAMEDQTTKIWETEFLNRKRKVPESGSIPDEATTPVKTVRNIPVNTNQKHLNLSQIYNKFSQPATSKPSGQSKHSYNQVSKVSTSKSHQGHPSSRGGHAKPRAHKQNKNASKIVISKSQMKKSHDLATIPTKQYGTVPMQLDFTVPPNTFQASYAQSLLGSKKSEGDDKPKILSPGLGDSATMQLLTQPATVPHDLAVADATAHEDPALQAQSTPSAKQTFTGKPCQLIIKKRGDITQTPDKKGQMPEIKILHKPSEGLKLLSNRQVVVTPGQKTPGKIITTKVLGPVVKSQPHTPVGSEKMIVVSKSISDHSFPNSKILMSSSTPSSAVSTSNVSPRIGETITAKGIPATDIKVSAAKTFLLNPKSGQKMVVVPAKTRTKSGLEGGQNLPLLQIKGMPTTMRLVPVSSQATTPVKSSAITVVSKTNVVNTMPPSAKVVSVEQIKTANMADIVPVKGLTPLTTPRTTKAIVRSPSAKGNVIVVQKGATIGKALSFTKNGNDMSKIIMGKNVNQLWQASKADTETAKAPGNVIVLELNNDQTARTTTMSEILDSRASSQQSVTEKKELKITEDTPVMFDTQITEETCNASSLDSTAESIGDIVPMHSSMPIIGKGSKPFSKVVEVAKETSSSVTDWEIELETTVSRKGKDDDDKLNSLHLDLGMSSDSDTDFIVDTHKSKIKHSPQGSIQGTTASGESRETYESSSGLSHATRTLLSQLQDEGSSSNDSSFALKSKRLKEVETKLDASLDKSEVEALSKAKEKLSEKVAKSQLKRIDIYSTAITTSDINLDSFSYLEEGMMAGDEEPRRAGPSLDEQLSRLLGEDSAASTDSHTVSENSPSNKQ